jgi:hypothetical protein
MICNFPTVFFFLTQYIARGTVVMPSCPYLPTYPALSFGINEGLPVLKALISHSVIYNVRKVC